jgi:hypothetical protein
MLSCEIIPTLTSMIQRSISKQSTWGLGIDSESQINLNTRLFIPPSDKTFLDFHIEFHLTKYQPNLLVQLNKNGNIETINKFILSDKSIIEILEEFVSSLVKDYDNKVDRNFELKLRSILSSGLIIEAETYQAFKEHISYESFIEYINSQEDNKEQYNPKQ